jgi:hypothetical protein
MARMFFQNTFGSQNSNLDLQRQDLFKFTINLPAVLGLSWTEYVEFAVEKFPFPERSIEVIGVKYMQQTNYLIGGDTPTPAIEVPIRYPFGQLTAQALEQWMWLIRNPLTGGVGLTSAVKTSGTFTWIVPNQSVQQGDISSTPTSTQTAMQAGLVYYLEGCLPKGFKFSDADMTTSGKVDCQLSLQIDRYYPKNVDSMLVSITY